MVEPNIQWKKGNNFDRSRDYRDLYHHFLMLASLL
jgi:hypothetical protein